MSQIPTPQRLLIVDDHVIMRRGLRNLIMMRLPHVLIEDAPSLSALEKALQGPSKPHVLILDLQLGDGNAMDILEDLRLQHPEIRILIYSMNQERIYGHRVLAMGCAGYLSKEAREEEVLSAIQLVLDGGSYIGPETEMRIQEQNDDRPDDGLSNPFDRLSRRELRVLDELLAGVGVKEISTRLGLSITTVATYKARLFNKLGIINLMEMKDLARLHGYSRS